MQEKAETMRDLGLIRIQVLWDFLHPED